ncbi:MAG: aminoglycoside phosphotransferase family protein [Candidatus Limnocylindria bacterium]
MDDGRLRPLLRPLTRSLRAASDRWDAVGIRSAASRWLASHGEWQIDAVTRSRSGTRIARIRSADGTRAILKIADSAHGARSLDREGRSLTKLAAEPRLAMLLALIPGVLAAGTDGRWSYLVQRALPGTPATPSLHHARTILADVSTLATSWHAATARQCVASEAELDEWVERPIIAMRDLVGVSQHAPVGATLARVGDELRSVLRGATTTLGWIHGDLWTDNILVRSDGAEITGIVDWDSASELGLALHDQLHLILYARKLTARSEIGDEVCRALGPEPDWDAVERPGLTAAIATMPGSDEPAQRRVGVLLYWLRLVAMNLARQPRATRDRRWLNKNVREVLECL